MQRKPDPPPLRTDDVRTVKVGTALWAATLILGAALRNWDVAATGVAGTGLGFVGIYYVQRRARAIARDEAMTSQNEPAAPES